MWLYEGPEPPFDPMYESSGDLYDRAVFQFSGFRNDMNETAAEEIREILWECMQRLHVSATRENERELRRVHLRECVRSCDIAIEMAFGFDPSWMFLHQGG
jgi:hypothetical protein